MSRPDDHPRRALGDRYEIERELGRGGMAIVYLAQDVRHRRAVALKVLKPEVAEALGSARFLREIEIAAGLSHPHIIPLLDSGEADGLLFYVMPYVSGESVRARLDREKQLPVDEAVEFATQVAAALRFAHNHGIVHRDIKPSNVLLAGGEAVVADFGIARALTAAGGTRLTQSGVAVGTPAYMSPEQASGDEDPGPRTDIYALGCLLYEMLVGEPPFTGATTLAIMARKLTESAPDVRVVRATVPTAVAFAIQKALAPVAADRHASALEFSRALRLPETEAAQAAAAARESAAPVVSRRILLVGAAMAGVVGFAGGAILPVTAGSRQSPRYRRITFQRGMIRTARFGPDYQTVLYGALWGGDVCRTYRVRPESPQSYPLDLPPAMPLAVSSQGEIALAMGTHFRGVLTSGTLARVPLAGGRPREMVENVRFADWSPDGSELAVVRIVDGRMRLEFPVGNVIAEPSPDLGAGFSFPRVSPDGSRVACFELANTLSGRVIVVDRRGNRTMLSPLSPNVFGLAWNGDEVWYTVAEERPLFRNAIHAIGADGSERVVARIPGNASLHDIAPDGRVLLARTEDRGGLAFRGADEPFARDLSWLDNSDVADISRDGASILFTEAGVGGGAESSVYLRDTDGGPAVRLGAGRALALAPDGEWALTASVTPGVPNDYLTLLPIGAGEARRLARAGLRYHEAVGEFLPDGERVLVYVTDGRGGYRYDVQEIDGDSTYAVTPKGVSVDSVLSPDGMSLAVSSQRGFTLYPIDGGEPREVSARGVQGRLLAWIEDGLLVRGTEAAPEDPAEDVIPIDLVDQGDGSRVRWTEIRPRDPAGLMSTMNQFKATPDGRWYAYSWHRALSDLYLVEEMA